MSIRRTLLLNILIILVMGAVLLPAATAVAQDEGAYERGLNLYRRQNFRAALEEFNKVLEAEPNRAEVLYLKGYCQYKLRQNAEAVDTFGKAFQANPQLDPRTIYRNAAAPRS